MRYTLKYSFLIVLNLFFCITSYAKTFYIKPTGNNSSNGYSIANAWQSISKINGTTFSAGDSILFEGGSTFNGSIYFSPSTFGTAQKPILISSYGSSKAIINAENSYGLFAYNNGGFQVDNLIFEGSGSSSNTDVGVLFYMDLTNNQKLSNITIKNVEAKGFKKAGIEISSYPSDNSRSGYNNIKILNCMAFNNGLVGISIVANFKINDTLHNHKNIQILNCIAHHNDGILNYTQHCGSGIVVGQADSCVIAYCEAYENGKNSNFPGAGPVGIWSWDSKFVKIEYCYSHHNRTQTVDGGGFDLDGGVQYSVMQYNYSFANDGPGFLIAQFTGARKMKNNIVRYNISEKDGKKVSLLIWSGDPAGTVTTEKIDVYNNTIYIDTVGNPLANAALAVYNNYGSMKDIRICNNIFMAKNNVNLVDLYPCLNLKFYNNAYYDFGNGFKFKDNGTTYTNLNNWRNATNQEIYGGKNVGFRINPNLINAGKAGSISNVDSLKTIAEYRFQGGSNLIGKGIFIDSLLGIKNLVKDYFGDTVVFNQQFSIGASEIPMPKPMFNTSNNCVNKLIFFENKSEKSLKYFWKFGDGNFSSVAQPAYKYLNAGNYTITLIAEGKYGYKDSVKKSITIYALPKAIFTTINGCLNDTFKPKNLSINSTTYKWHLGNGDSSSFANPKIQYKSAGSYNVKLIANQQELCFDTLQKIVEVYPLPIASFFASNKCINDSVEVKNNSTNTFTYLWNMGNGDTLVHPSSFKYKYSNAGNYTIELIAKSINGCVNKNMQMLTIYSLPKALFNVQNNCIYQSTVFHNLSADSCMYNWQFTSVDSSRLQNPQFVFLEAKKYNVSLNILDKNGCKNSVVKNVEIYRLPNARFSYIQTNNTFKLSPFDTLNSSYEWQFPDSIIQNKIAEYKPKQSGDFVVKLKVKNANNCDSNFQILIPFQKTNFKQNKVSDIQLQAFSNPFSESTFIHYSLNIRSHVSLAIVNNEGKIYNVFNNKLQNQGLQKLELGSTIFKSSGLYTVQLVIEGKLYFFKVLKL